MSSLTPPKPGITYLPHQEAGIRWMMAREADNAPFCRGGILADDMGLGKTFQTIGLMKNGTERKTLIVCPPALTAGWQTELEACGYEVITLMPGAPMWTSSVSSNTPTVHLTTYTKLALYAKQLAPQSNFERVVLDEGHIIRNGDIKTSYTSSKKHPPQLTRWAATDMMAAKATATRSSQSPTGGSAATARWILSATPIQNGRRDWNHLCEWLQVPENQYDQSVATRDETGINMMPSADTIMLRRTMAELRDTIAALPPPPKFIHHDLHVPTVQNEGSLNHQRVGGVPTTSEEYKVFQALCNQLENAIDAHLSGAIKLELYLRIQQFLVHPQIYIDAMRAKLGGAYRRADWSATATKWTAVMKELAASVRSATPSIVFCYFREEIDRVVAATKSFGAATFTVRGGMGHQAIGEAVTAAREAAAAGKPVVMVVQIVSGGVGLNLQFAKRVYFLSQHWNPAVVHQAVGRAVRIGQTATVEIHTFRVVDHVLDNLDRRMAQVHLDKIDVAQKYCPTFYEGYEPIEDEYSEDFLDWVAPAPATETMKTGKHVTNRDPGTENYIMVPMESNSDPENP